MNEGKFYVKRKKKKGKSAEKNRTRRRGEKRQNFSLCLSCCCSKKTDKRRGDKKKAHKSFFFTRKKKRTRKQKNHIMSADELKQKGNEAFKRNEFKLACEIFTEAIELDATNHVLYSNRSAARVILIIMCIFCAYSCVHFRSVFRSSSSV